MPSFPPPPAPFDGQPVVIGSLGTAVIAAHASPRASLQRGHTCLHMHAYKSGPGPIPRCSYTCGVLLQVLLMGGLLLFAILRLKAAHQKRVRRSMESSNREVTLKKRADPFVQMSDEAGSELPNVLYD